MMHYKGFTGVVEIDEEAGTLFGKVIGLRDVITFQAGSVPEARKAFEESVDSYLEFCASRGEQPEKPYSGKFLLRIDPELHRALALAAEAGHTSLNALAEKFLSIVKLNVDIDTVLHHFSSASNLKRERPSHPNETL